jgi:hypothetical protein
VLFPAGEMGVDAEVGIQVGCVKGGLSGLGTVIYSGDWLEWNGNMERVGVVCFLGEGFDGCYCVVYVSRYSRRGRGHDEHSLFLTSSLV